MNGVKEQKYDKFPSQALLHQLPSRVLLAQVFQYYLCWFRIPEIPKLREYIRKRGLDKKRRLVTKYVTEAFGLLLLTDTFNSEESLLVRKAPGLSNALPVQV